MDAKIVSLEQAFDDGMKAMDATYGGVSMRFSSMCVPQNVNLRYEIYFGLCFCCLIYDFRAFAHLTRTFIDYCALLIANSLQVRLKKISNVFQLYL